MNRIIIKQTKNSYQKLKEKGFFKWAYGLSDKVIVEFLRNR